MKDSLIEKAAIKYGKDLLKIDALNEGLIHKTYKVVYQETPPILLQCINKNIFSEPKNIIENYCLVEQHLLQNQEPLKIPKLLPCNNGLLFLVDEENNFWRAFEFIKDSYSVSNIETAGMVFSAANCFARFTKSLAGLDVKQLNIIIPHFHDLSLRFKQFEDAVSTASTERLQIAEELIHKLKERKTLIDFYEGLDDESYPLRIMHHDCKINNILFSSITNEIICPVDLDTIMPGKFFSDLGDMIRTMACSVDENNTEWELINVKEDYYKNILEGYLEGVGNTLTAQEIKHVHFTGLLMTYMQALRFLADYLNNDIYYQTSYKKQNLDRAKNQLIFLEKLELFLHEEYNVRPYFSSFEK